MTFRRPSRISRSFRLSNSFLTCKKGRSRIAGLELKLRLDPVDCAASMVRSRASRYQQEILGTELHQVIPVSSIDEILEIDSMVVYFSVRFK